MIRLYWFFMGVLLYMELIYHTAAFGMKEMNPILLIPMLLLIAGIETLLSGLGRKKFNRYVLYILLAVNALIYSAQVVYISIFQQPLLFAAMTGVGQDALTDFWKEALNGILGCSAYILLLFLPIAAAFLFMKYRVFVLRRHKKKVRITTGIYTGIGAVCIALILGVGYYNQWNLYEEYQGFYDPSKIVSSYGLMPTIGRDCLGDLLPSNASALETLSDNGDAGTGENADSVENAADEENTGSNGNTNASGTDAQTVQAVTYEPNMLDINFEELRNLADKEEIKQLASYMEAMPATSQNEYTGMFEGYNLIYITAEGFSQYAVDETLTPTLYKLTHSGFVVEDYYVPLWQTSTSDGEYVNLMGLIPDQQLSFRRTQNNTLPYTLPQYFAKEGVKSFAYHNNTLTYYERHLTHPNMGYPFKAAQLGKLTMEEGGDKLFSLASPDLWPASDLEMIQATLPEYINEERFHTYYMTVSGHMEYTFEGNHMSEKNKELVAALPYSDEVKAYIACNIELDRALEYLIAELEKAGKLDKTVIAISSDHYPYGLEMDKLQEIAGKPLEGTLDLYRNSLVLWNSAMGTVEVDKTCCAMDLLPTIYNLFGFDYDSRLFAGRDMLSDSEGLVIFSDRSFITDSIIYHKEDGTPVSRTGEIVDEAYFQQIKTTVQGLYEYSAGILNHDFYRYVEQVD